MDVSGLGPMFQIVDIVTPFGFLRDSIPLPGDVVQAMNDSIQTLKTNYRPTILLGPPSSLVFNVDEGRGVSLPQSGRLTNSGVFGSLLDGTLVTSAPYIKTSPTVVGGLPFNQSGDFDVTVDSTNLLTASSPYSASISVQDTNATNSPQVFPITINVRPKAVITASPATVAFSVSAPLTGPFPPVNSSPFTVSNTGPTNSVLDYQIVRLIGLSQNWLESFTPVSGTLASGQSVTVNVTVAPIEGLSRGTYTETLRISGYSSNNYTDVLIQLDIT